MKKPRKSLAEIARAVWWDHDCIKEASDWKTTGACTKRLWRAITRAVIREYKRRQKGTP